MASVSGKYAITLSAILSASFAVSGCNALTAVKQAGITGNDDAAESAQEGRQAGDGLTRDRNVSSKDVPVETSQQLELSSGSAPLPRQVYSAKGEKVPYVPEKNPYTRDTTPVPTEARAMFVAASTQFKRGDLTGARAKFGKISDKYPHLAGPWVRLGDIAQRDGKHAEAAGHYKKAIGLNKKNVNAYIALALVQRKQGQFNSAQNTYLAALDVWKDFPEAHLNLAILYDLYANRPEAAQKHYEAYYFLTGEKDKSVRKWLVEVKHRTGIEESFIDIPPAGVAGEPLGEVDKASVTSGPENPG
ncbi:MAG: tetratricopeptide repeat protein [Gammaproteobacteria bacterium]|nr:tetratricopeptide repeat protein [Gammaproteobacteria bacterium]